MDLHAIEQTLEIEGGIFLPDFFSTRTIEDILDSFSDVVTSGLNNNNSGLVYFLQQKFVSQTLVHSNPVFNFVTKGLFYNLCNQYLKEPVIKAARYYETGPGGISLWHHDEKNSGYASQGVSG